MAEIQRSLAAESLGPADARRLQRGTGDWWRVAMMVAAVVCGSGLLLYALLEWAAGM